MGHPGRRWSLSCPDRRCSRGGRRSFLPQERLRQSACAAWGALLSSCLASVTPPGGARFPPGAVAVGTPPRSAPALAGKAPPSRAAAPTARTPSLPPFPPPPPPASSPPPPPP